MAFDVAGNVPAGATITSATLALRLIMAPNNAPNQTHALHKITADWGEGTSATDAGNGAPSTPGDATWKHRFFDTQNWTTLGGDFLATVSAQQTVGTDTLNDYTWSSTQMVADVQGWLNNPATNFGWLLQGNETSTMTARKFHSREDFDATVRPRLTIVYTPAPVCAGDVNHNHVVDVNDLLAVVSTWGPCPAPCPPPCTADISPTGSGNCVVDVNDLLAVISSWGPCP
jgi:hypothetical protein